MVINPGAASQSEADMTASQPVTAVVPAAPGQAPLSATGKNVAAGADTRADPKSAAAGTRPAKKPDNSKYDSLKKAWGG
jgi:hypothetical protein